MSTLTRADDLLTEAGLDPVEVRGLLRAALREDLGDRGDITSAATVPRGVELSVRWTVREPGVVAGLPVLAALVEEHLGADAGLRLLAHDGEGVDSGQVIASLTAPAALVLEVERTSLNLLGHLSGVATLTRAWVDAVEGTGARIRDTRKTMPLLRSLQKYAVRCGGGVNHRAGLFDAVLVKDNHVAAAGGVGAALDAVAAAGLGPGTVVQVEVDDLDQLREALAHGATQVLLDNMTVPVLREAVALVRREAPGVLLEASGGLTLDTAHDVAATGVDHLAVGALTHSAPQLDIALDTTPDRRNASRVRAKRESRTGETRVAYGRNASRVRPQVLSKCGASGVRESRLVAEPRGIENRQEIAMTSRRDRTVSLPNRSRDHARHRDRRRQVWVASRSGATALAFLGTYDVR